MKKVVLALAVFSLLVLAGCSGAGEVKYSQAELAEFAKCLTEDGTTMYGAFWCPHCANTKKRFGSAFQFVNYVECDPNGDNEQAELCLEKEIRSYDTWEFGDGSRTVGEPTFEELSQGSGCPLPGAEVAAVDTTEPAQDTQAAEGAEADSQEEATEPADDVQEAEADVEEPQGDA